MTLAGCFSKVFKNGFMAKSTLDYSRSLIARYYGIWEPDYLIYAQTKTPEYDLINVQIKGYDFAILEKYQKYIKRLALILELDIVKSWASPQQDLLIHHYKPNSVDVEYKYNLKLSERNIQVVDVKSHIMPLFIETVVTTCPPGVLLSFHHHEDQMEEDRYVPNLDILELKEVLEEIGSDKKKKKKTNLKDILNRNIRKK